jgi:arylformamidase
MKTYDISLEISENMPVYKDKPEKKPKISITRTLKEGTNEARIEADLHTGTHVDSPYHTISGGKTIEKISLDKFFGNAVVLDFTKTKGCITGNDLKKHSSSIKKNSIVLLKTRNKPMKIFDFNFTYLEKSGAKFLASRKIKAVGIDGLGVERAQEGHPTHNILLGKNILIFEGLDLSKIKEGSYTFYGFPLKIKNADASLVRAVLIR